LLHFSNNIHLGMSRYTYMQLGNAHSYIFQRSTRYAVRNVGCFDPFWLPQFHGILVEIFISKALSHDIY